MQYLVLARAKPNTKIEDLLPYVEEEASISWKYTNENMLRQIHYISDLSGAVSIWEAPNKGTVEEAIKEFPMYRENLLNFEVIELMPYNSISLLFKEDYNEFKPKL
ncbi:MAG: hypothetical protein ACFB0B_02375 [Thermonemataceae bacterium]